MRQVWQSWQPQFILSVSSSEPAPRSLFVSLRRNFERASERATWPPIRSSARPWRRPRHPRPRPRQHQAASGPLKEALRCVLLQRREKGPGFSLFFFAFVKWRARRHVVGQSHCAHRPSALASSRSGVQSLHRKVASPFYEHSCLPPPNLRGLPRCSPRLVRGDARLPRRAAAFGAFGAFGAFAWPLRKNRRRKKREKKEKDREREREREGTEIEKAREGRGEERGNGEEKRKEKELEKREEAGVCVCVSV